MRDGTLDKAREVKRLISSESMSVRDACKQAGISDATYYKCKLSNGNGKPKQKFIDIPIKQKTNVAIIVCQPDQLKSVIEGLT